MTIYIVTSKSEERDNAGKLLRATCNIHGAFTSEVLANGAADKYRGTVVSLYADAEQVKQILQTWNVNR